MNLKKGMASLAAAAFAAVFSASGHAASFTGFIDSFELPNPKGKWAVFPTVGDTGEWDTTKGAGIEIQTNGTVGGVKTDYGNQYVELDSHPKENSNSAMTRLVTLGPGTYELGFVYRPRTNNKNSNGISVYFDKGTAAMSNEVAAVGGSKNDPEYKGGKWETFTYEIDVKDLGTYALTFAATGKQDTLGGFVDYVTFFAAPGNRPGEVPLPAAAWLFLSVMGGAGLLRRKAAKA